MQPLESQGNTPEFDTGHSDVPPVPEISMPVMIPELDTGREASVPLPSDVRLSTGATPEVNGRVKRITKPVERLVVGNPAGWHFNRSKARK